MENTTPATQGPSTELTPVIKSELGTLSKSMGLDVSPEEMLRTLMRTVFKDPKNEATQAHLAVVLHVANKHGLDPFTREIYAFLDKRNGVVPIVSTDGWSNIANSHPQFDGMKYEDVLNAEGKLVAIRAWVFRKDRSHPIGPITEYLEECRRGSPAWSSNPSRMLRHRCKIQALREAFGYAGFYDLDEGMSIVESVAGGADNIIEIDPTAHISDEQHNDLLAMIDRAMNLPQEPDATDESERQRNAECVVSVCEAFDIVSLDQLPEARFAECRARIEAIGNARRKVYERAKKEDAETVEAEPAEPAAAPQAGRWPDDEQPPY